MKKISPLQELSLRIYSSLKKNHAFEKLLHEQRNITNLEINSEYEKIIELMRIKKSFIKIK